MPCSQLSAVKVSKGTQAVGLPFGLKLTVLEPKLSAMLTAFQVEAPQLPFYPVLQGNLGLYCLPKTWEIQLFAYHQWVEVASSKV